MHKCLAAKWLRRNLANFHRDLQGRLKATFNPKSNGTNSLPRLRFVRFQYFDESRNIATASGKLALSAYGILARLRTGKAESVKSTGVDRPFGDSLRTANKMPKAKHGKSHAEILSGENNSTTFNRRWQK